jgi:hypothetical protein
MKEISLAQLPGFQLYLIHDGAGRWNQAWELSKRLLQQRQVQDEETIRKKRRKKIRSDKKSLFLDESRNLFLHPCRFLNGFTRFCKILIALPDFIRI